MFPLILSNLSVWRHGKTVLGPIDLVIDQGGPTMVIGPNGSGKTTLLRVMHGIEHISEGTVDWAQPDHANHAYVFQSPVVLRRTVAENLSYPLSLINQLRENSLKERATIIAISLLALTGFLVTQSIWTYAAVSAFSSLIFWFKSR